MGWQDEYDTAIELPLRSEIMRLRTAAGAAASILSRHLSMQLSSQESWVELRKAREALVSVLRVNK